MLNWTFWTDGKISINEKIISGRPTRVTSEFTKQFYNRRFRIGDSLFVEITFNNLFLVGKNLLQGFGCQLHPVEHRVAAKNVILA